MSDTATHEYDAFYKPDAPRSDWEFLKWFFFEPTLLRNFEQTLYKKDFYWKYFTFIKFNILFHIVPYLFIVFFIAFLDLPNLYPEYFSSDLQENWNILRGFQMKFWYYLKHTFFSTDVNFFHFLFFGLFWGLLSGSFLRISFGLEFFFSFSFGFFFSFVLTFLTAFRFNNFSCLFVYSLSYLTAYLRLPLYLFYQSFFFRRVTLTNNPYLYDEVIRLPILGVDAKLVKAVKENPALAKHFVDFLLRYRQLQKPLAAELSHVIITTYWHQAIIIKSQDIQKALYINFDNENDEKKYNPSDEWVQLVGEIETSLKNAELQHNTGSKLEFYKKCQIQINEWAEINLRESFESRVYYFETIKHWQRLIKEEIQSVEEQLAHLEPITRNPYSKGTALSPDRENRNLFLDRHDLKDEISLKILTSETMPLFLIQGQRRVGKTTLLKFLPELLDSTRFKVVYQDLQGFGSSRSVSEWLQDLWVRIDEQLQLEGELPTFNKNADALDTWEQFKDYLSKLNRLNYKIILAFDEYDAALPKMFQRNVAQSEDLLGRMRSFSQHQNDVIFMFIGSAFFSELKNPNWGNYFVHVSNFRVDYLSRNASLQLITAPTPTFNLKYEEGVADRIYDLTLGQPHLLHFICSELVDYANAKYQNPIKQSDLDYVLKEKLLQKAEQPFSVFWEEFCENNAMKKVVKAIAFQEAFEKNSHFQRLKEHGYIVEQADGNFKMRVPLFEQWIKLYGYWDE